MVILQFYYFVLQLLYFICNSFGWDLRRGEEEEDRVTRRQHIAPLGRIGRLASKRCIHSKDSPHTSCHSLGLE